MIEIQNSDGSVSKYQKLSERLPAFLKAFPFSEGYRVIITTKALSEVTDTETAQGIIFTASLYQEDKEIVNASSCRLPPAHIKDWEKGETAARQRLLAACGFGGDILDEDEEGDISDLGGLVKTVPARKKETPSEAPTASQASTQAEQPEAIVEPPAEKESAPEPEPVSEAPQEQLAMEPVQAAEQSDQDNVPPEEQPPVAMVRQIEHLCKIHKRDFVQPKTKSEARTMLKELMQKPANAA